MYKKILSGLMALAMVAPAFTNVTSAGGTGSVPVKLNAAATNFSVTVPTGLPVDVAADGTITVCQENYIINNSFGPVEVKGAKIETANGWTLKDFTSRFETLKVNAQEFGFQLNGCNVGTDGAVAVTNFKPIDGKASQKFTYDAKVAPQANELGKQQIASVVFTLGWSGANILSDGKPHARGTTLSSAKLGQQAWTKTGTITFSREKHNVSKHGTGVDVSEAGDGSVMCVVNGEDVTVYGDGGVKAPADCSGLFTTYFVNGNIWEPYKAKKINLDGLDTSGVTEMWSMFLGSYATSLDLSNFDTSNVTNMQAMFLDSSATSLDLSNFDTRNVTGSMAYMFRGSNATILDLSSFDMSGVTYTQDMFISSKAERVYCRTENDKQKMLHSANRTPPVSAFVVGHPQ